MMFDRALLPEVLAITLAQLKYTKNHNKDARVVMAHWTATFSIAEKQRFLGAAARHPEFVDMCEYMDMLKYEDFDLLMLLNFRSTNAVVRSLVGRLGDKGKEIIAQIDTWLDFTIIDTLAILRQSAFMTPELERKLMPRMHNRMFIRGARLVASHFKLPFPPKLISQQFALITRLILNAYKEEEMGGRDMVIAISELTRKEDALWELASMMAEDEKGAAVLQYREEGKKAIANTPKCWSTPGTPLHQARSIEYNEIDSPQRMIEAKSVVESSSGIIHVAFRLVNRPAHGPYLAVVMFQTEEGLEKSWLDCLDPPRESIPLIESIISKSRYAHNAGELQVAIFNTFRVLLPALTSIPALLAKGAKYPKELAAKIRKQRCLATRKRVILARKDMDECFLFHLSLELDLVVSCKDWLESKK